MIELQILEEEVYSSEQAKALTVRFFSKNPPDCFSFIHGGGEEGAYYGIENYSSTNGNTFSIYFLVKETASTSYIHEFWIEYD